MLTQRRMDKERGLNTAGFVSGYRGSPLGGVDMAMWKAQKALDANQISFLPGINEDLAATAVMGTQQAGMRADRKVDGVFAMWYGKGPGVDRAGDALHHGNAAGASRNGGVLVVVGDDHTAVSSSIPHASEASLIGWQMPIVHPSSIDEYETFALWAGRCRATRAPGWRSRPCPRPSNAAIPSRPRRRNTTTCRRIRTCRPKCWSTRPATSCRWRSRRA